MGIYITQPSTDKEDIGFIQELITKGQAYFNNGKIYYKADEYNEEKVIWEICDKNIQSRFLGDPGPFNSIFGYGRFTREGYSFLFVKLQQLHRTSSIY